MKDMINKTRIAIDGLKQTKQIVNNRLWSLRDEMYLPGSVKDALEAKMETLEFELEKQINMLEDAELRKGGQK